MDSFRDRFGVDWLQYKRLEEHNQVSVICRSRSADETTGRPAEVDLQSESFDPKQVKPQLSPKESSPAFHNAGAEEEPEVQPGEPPGGEQREEEADELMLGEEEDEKPEGKWFFFTVVCEGLDDGRIVGSNVIFVVLYHTIQHCGPSRDIGQAGLKACFVH